MLPVETQQLAAGHQQLQVRTGREQLRKSLRRCDHVLEVVEQHEQPPVGDVLGKTVPGLNGSGCLLEDEVRVTDGGERNPPDTVRVAVGNLRRGLQRETRLPRPARPGQRKEPHTVFLE